MRTRHACLLTATIILTGCAGTDPEPAAAPTTTVTTPPTTEAVDTPDPEPTDTGHDGSKLACRHFRNVMGDVADGVLTDEEIRDKVREIDENAAIATDEIQQATRGLLSATTTGTVEEFVDAAQQVSDGCQDAGW